MGVRRPGGGILTPKEFLAWCRQEIERGGDWNYRIHKSWMYKELCDKYDNVEEIVALARKQMVDKPLLKKVVEGIHVHSEKPMEFFDAPVTPSLVAGLVEFRMNIGGYQEAVEKVRWDIGGERFHELIIEELRDLGRVPLEMEEP